MTRAKVLLLALVAVGVAAFAVVPSAFASGPTLLFSGGNGPTVLLKTKTDNPNNGIAGELQSELATIASSGLFFEITLLQTASGVEGIYLVLFLKSKITTGEKPECNTSKDAAGEILLPTNTAKLVYDTLSPALGVAALLNVSKVEIECKALKLKVEGSVLSLIKPINTAIPANKEEIESFTACSAKFGIPSEKKYWNSAGTELEASLKVTVGGEKVEGCESTSQDTNKAVLLSSNKAIETMG
jgi:hypothetical protein